MKGDAEIYEKMKANSVHLQPPSQIRALVNFLSNITQLAISALIKVRYYIYKICQIKRLKVVIKKL
jgi:hypothetical protein